MVSCVLPPTIKKPAGDGQGCVAVSLPNGVSSRWPPRAPDPLPREPPSLTSTHLEGTQPRPPRSAGLNLTHPWPRCCVPLSPSLSFLSLKPLSAQSAPLQAPRGSRPQPGRLTAAAAQPEHLFWGHDTRILSGSLPLVPEDLSSTLEKEVLLDARQLWPQPREQPWGLPFCSDVTSGGLL